jgi:hypothetical protein
MLRWLIAAGENVVRPGVVVAIHLASAVHIHVAERDIVENAGLAGSTSRIAACASTEAVFQGGQQVISVIWIALETTGGLVGGP